jgi:hypothetical protein
MSNRFSPGSKYLQARAEALIRQVVEEEETVPKEEEVTVIREDTPAPTMVTTRMEEEEEQEDLETIEEATIETEATEESAASTLIKDLQDQLEKELERHNGTVRYHQGRIKDEEARHYKVQQDLEAKLLQALRDSESIQEDGDYWLNNKPVPKNRPGTRKPTSDEKTLIRARVKREYLRSQGR